METKVEAVIINWMRPGNVRKIVDAFRAQSVPCKVTVCECAPKDEFRLDADTRARIDVIHEFKQNFGPYSRYMNSAKYDCQFTYLHDDDMLPGRKLIEHFLRNADKQPDFAVLGQMGRILNHGHYNGVDIDRQPGRLTLVDFIIRAYFVRTANLKYLEPYKMELGLSSVREDDLLLAAAIRRRTGLSCWLTEASDDPEERVIREDLPDEHAMSKTVDHFRRRDQFVKMLRNHGWKPIHPVPWWRFW